MYTNVAAYQFVTLTEDELPLICKNLKARGTSLTLKGTILLSTEGINLFLAGKEESISAFQEEVAKYEYFKNLTYKYSYSDFVPFQKLCVKIRKEIVTFKQDHIAPEKFTAPHIHPKMLKSWLQENKDMILLDTRNQFEFEMGTFSTAVHLAIQNFREFPQALAVDQELDRNKPIVTFCTGGIRCEKAAAYLLQQGFKEVYQLEGGILNYFEQCGGAFYQGNCFVFDDRNMLNNQLEPIDSNINP